MYQPIAPKLNARWREQRSTGGIVGVAGILGSGLSLERSRACRPCRCSKATLLRYCSTGVGVRATGGGGRARVMTGWDPVWVLDSRADEKADDGTDSLGFDEWLKLDRLGTIKPC